MKNILIVEDDEDWKNEISARLSQVDKEWVLWTASDGAEAMDVASSMVLDLVVTDLRMPRVDGFQLITFLIKKFPRCPVIVLSGMEGVDSRSLQQTGSILFVLRKPAGLESLPDCARTALHQVQSGSVQGITLASFLQMLAFEGKTCTLTIRSRDKEGAIYCVQGEPRHAAFRESIGMEAFSQMLSWDRIEIDMIDVCHLRLQTIRGRMQDLLLDAAVLVDERRRQGLPEPPANGAAKPAKPFSLFGFGRAAAEPHLDNERFLQEVAQIPGATEALLIHLKSGKSAAALKKSDLSEGKWVAEQSELLRRQQKLMQGRSELGRFESLIVVTDTRFQILRLLPEPHALYVSLSLHRAVANLGSALHQLERLVAETSAP